MICNCTFLVLPSPRLRACIDNFIWPKWSLSWPICLHFYSICFYFPCRVIQRVRKKSDFVSRFSKFVRSKNEYSKSSFLLQTGIFEMFRSFQTLCAIISGLQEQSIFNPFLYCTLKSRTNTIIIHYESISLTYSLRTVRFYFIEEIQYMF